MSDSFQVVCSWVQPQDLFNSASLCDDHTFKPGIGTFNRKANSEASSERVSYIPLQPGFDFDPPAIVKAAIGQDLNLNSETAFIYLGNKSSSALKTRTVCIESAAVSNAYEAGRSIRIVNKLTQNVFAFVIRNNTPTTVEVPAGKLAQVSDDRWDVSFLGVIVPKGSELSIDQNPQISGAKMALASLQQQARALLQKAPNFAIDKLTWNWRLSSLGREWVQERAEFYGFLPNIQDLLESITTTDLGTECKQFSFHKTGEDTRFSYEKEGPLFSDFLNTINYLVEEWNALALIIDPTSSQRKAHASFVASAGLRQLAQTIALQRQQAPQQQPVAPVQRQPGRSFFYALWNCASTILSNIWNSIVSLFCLEA